jgi:hypothetical protein
MMEDSWPHAVEIKLFGFGKKTKKRKVHILQLGK